MGEGLLIQDDVLRRGHASLVAAKGDFDQVQDRADDAAGACGYGPLARVLRDSSSDWALRRGKLAEALANLAGHMKAAIDGFEKWEVNVTQALQGDGTTRTQQPVPPSAAVTQQGGSGSGAGAGAPSAPPPAMPPAVPAEAAGEAASGATASRQSPATAEAGRPPAADSTAAPSVSTADLGRGLPDVGPPGPGGVPVAVVGGVSGQVDVAPHGNLRLDDARLDDLLTELVQRWQSLGGQEKSIVAALVGAGALGVVGTVSRSGGRAALRDGAATDEAIGSAPVGGSPYLGGAGAGSPVAGVAEHGLPRTTVDGPAGEDSAVGEPVLAGSEEAAEPSATDAVASPAPPPALGAPGVEAAPQQRAASGEALAIGEADAGSASAGPQAPAALTGLDSAGSGGAAAMPAALPSLGADPVPASPTESAALPAPLPPLSNAAAPAGASVAAAAVPLSASLLPSASRPAAGAFTASTGTAGLPSLAVSAGAGSGPEEERRGVDEEAVRDARKILADLARAVSDEEER